MLETYKVNTDFVSTLPMLTTFVFMSRADNGEREFAFNRGADEQLMLDDAAVNSLSNDSILHLGSATALLGGSLGDTYLKLAKAAKHKGNIICVVPNYRIDLWKNREDDFRQACIPYFKMSDIVNVSDDELTLLSQQENMESGC